MDSSVDALTTWIRRVGPARATLAIVAVLLGANILFNLAMMLVGAKPPFTFFAMGLDVMFDDFFKYVEGFPGGHAARPTIVPGLGRMVWLGAHPAFTGTLTNDWPTHYHNPPLTILYGLAMARAVQVFDPGLLFLVTIALLGWWGWRVAGLAGSERGIWARLLLISYPTIVALTRANMFAAACALLLVHAMVLVTRGRAPLLAALLIAVAVNLRPNAIVFAGPLLVTAAQPWRVAGVLTLVAGGLFASTMAISHALYPVYGWATFTGGVAHYYQLYVVENLGLAYGSSLFGGLKLLFGWRPGLDRLALIPPALLALGGAAVWFRGRLTRASLVFLVAAVYVTASTVIADYHLLVFLAVPMMIAARADDAPVSPAEAVALATSALLLAPKNELFIGEVSLQVLFNPLILLAGGAMVLALSARVARLGAALAPGLSQA